jgi:hypothetical protein
VPQSFVTKTRDKKAALNFLKKYMKRYGRPHILARDKHDRGDFPLGVVEAVLQRTTGLVNAAWQRSYLSKVVYGLQPTFLTKEPTAATSAMLSLTISRFCEYRPRSASGKQHRSAQTYVQ